MRSDLATKLLDKIILPHLAVHAVFQAHHNPGPSVIQSGALSIELSDVLRLAEAWNVSLFGFSTSSSATGLYRRRVAAKTDVWQPYVLPQRQRGETMTSVSADHIILTPTQPVGCGRPEQGTNPRPPWPPVERSTDWAANLKIHGARYYNHPDNYIKNSLANRMKERLLFYRNKIKQFKENVRPLIMSELTLQVCCFCFTCDIKQSSVVMINWVRKTFV